jgi:hypothetical protein
VRSSWREPPGLSWPLSQRDTYPAAKAARSFRADDGRERVHSEENGLSWVDRPKDAIKEIFGSYCSIGATNRDVAHALIDCDISITVLAELREDGCSRYDVTLTAPPDAYDVVADRSTRSELELRFILATLDAPYFNKLHIRRSVAGAPNVPLPGNQARGGPRKVTWNRLGFRSETELHLAQALDDAGVMFFPNCLARLGAREARHNGEPDFLVCHEGKWGVLEAHGSDWHPAERKVDEEERARTFRRHGIRVVEHYDAARCYEAPREVVADFLGLLSRNG